MLISVIIPAYNYAKYIERAIRSCLDQSISKDAYEVIIINDASTDNTKHVIENYTDLITVINLDKNIGLAASRNLGVRKAKGRFVFFLDADDYIHRDTLLVEQLFLSENTSLDAAAVDYYLVDERGNHLEYVSAEERPIACGIMFRKDFLFDVGLFDESFHAREEEDLRLRYLKKYKIHYLKIPLYRYRMHDSNLTKDSEKMDHYKNKLNDKHKLNNE